MIYDLRRDASTDAIKAGVKEMGLDWLNSMITRWVFKHVLLKRAYSLEDFRQMAGETPFRTSFMVTVADFRNLVISPA